MLIIISYFSCANIFYLLFQLLIFLLVLFAEGGHLISRDPEYDRVKGSMIITKKKDIKNIKLSILIEILKVL